MILVTGATGTNGSEVVKLLATHKLPVRAMVRDLSTAASLQRPNIELVAGDFDRPHTLSAVLHGVERAFLLTNSTERAEAQQLAFVEAAQQSGVRHIVKLSQLHAASDSPVRFLRYHAAVEAAIRASGMAYTFLRPNLFMQSLLLLRSIIKAHSILPAPVGDAQVSIVDVRDIAAVAVAVLTEDGHAGATYDLSGPQALTHAELAAALGHVLGRTISIPTSRAGPPGIKQSTAPHLPRRSLLARSSTGALPA